MTVVVVVVVAPPFVALVTDELVLDELRLPAFLDSRSPARYF